MIVKQETKARRFPSLGGQISKYRERYTAQIAHAQLVS
jgi:hypothetical protein